MSMRIGFGLRMTDNKGKGAGGGGAAIVNHTLIASQLAAPTATITLPWTPTKDNILFAFYVNNGNPPTVNTGWTKIDPDNSAQTPSSYVGATMVWRLVQAGDTATIPTPFGGSLPGISPPIGIQVWEVSGIASYAAAKLSAQYYENTNDGVNPAVNGWPVGTLAAKGLALMSVFRRSILDTGTTLPAGMTQDDMVDYAGSRRFISGHQALDVGAYSCKPQFSAGSETSYYSICFVVLKV